MSFEWYPKKTEDNKHTTEHNKDTEKDIASENSSDNNDILSDSAHSKVTTLKFVCHKQKKPCEPTPKCPPPPDPFNIKFQCGTKDVTFKLKCKELPPSRENPKSTFECRLVDEEQCLNMVIAMAAADLKCKRVQSIHSAHAKIEDDTDEAQEPIVVQEVENKMEDKNLPKE